MTTLAIGESGTTPAITAAGIHKSYGDKVVLDGVDLSIPEGTVFARGRRSGRLRRPQFGTHIGAPVTMREIESTRVGNETPGWPVAPSRWVCR
jgi:hypothetical protein